MQYLKQHRLIIFILIIQLVLSLIYTVMIPLGEAPDEFAQLNYARFIAENGRLPATLDERRGADYRASWPPLYYSLTAVPLAIVGNTPPTRLKSVGDTPRRLIPTNGQTIASFIHTADETYPWRGLPLAWHLGRIISVLLSILATTLTYVIVLRLTGGRYNLATATAALYAFIPQQMFIGSIINDGNLLNLLSALIFLLLVSYNGLRSAFLLGLTLGLASVTHYNALPMWAIVFVWVGLLIRSPVQRLAQTGLLLGGAVLSGGWWFIFAWTHFNRVAELGIVRGSLAALVAGTNDASVRKVAGGEVTTLPDSGWLEWAVQLFKSFWGLFGGGGTIEFSVWIYWLLAIFCFIAFMGWFLAFHTKKRPSTKLILFLLSPLFFLPLPLLRFILTGGNIAETAQGRHLFPALPAISFALVWGISLLALKLKREWINTALPATAFLLSLYALVIINGSYPLPIPLTTGAVEIDNMLNIPLTNSITLVGYELGEAIDGYLPVTLLWQAKAIPIDDYIINVKLSGQITSSWLGHPIGGRYPTRAWDEGDILRHTIIMPILLANSQTDHTTLTLSLLDSQYRPVTNIISLTNTVVASPAFIAPTLFRADGLAKQSPFGYRSTISLALPANNIKQPELIAPSGQRFTATQIIHGSDGSTLAHFIVDAHWSSGSYSLSVENMQAVQIKNRLRQFEPPVMEHTLNANFAGYLTLLGYDLPTRRLTPGGTFPVTLYWRAEKPLGESLTVFNHLLNGQAIQWGGADRIPLKYYSTLLWVTGEIVSDSYELPISADAPSGIYQLDIGLYPTDNPISLPLLVNGQLIDRNSVSLAPVKVGDAPPGLLTPNATPQTPLNIPFGNQITLLGFNLNGENLTLFWRADTQPVADYTVFIHIFDNEGNLTAQFDSPPANGVYPTSLWDAGEIIADNRQFRLSPGHYTIQAGLYSRDTGQRLPAGDSTDGVVKLTSFEVGF